MLLTPQNCACLSQERQKPHASLQCRRSPFCGHNADVAVWGLGPEGFCAIQIVAMYADRSRSARAASGPEGQNGSELMHLFLCVS